MTGGVAAQGAAGGHDQGHAAALPGAVPMRFFRGMWLAWLVLALAAVSYVFVRALVLDEDAASAAAMPSLCVMKQTTGAPCPLCGGTRASIWLAQGRVERALLFQPVGVFGFALFLLSIPLAVVGCVRPQPANRVLRRWVLRRKLVVATIAVVAGIWIARVVVTEEALLDALDAVEHVGAGVSATDEP